MRYKLAAYEFFSKISLQRDLYLFVACAENLSFVSLKFSVITHALSHTL